MILRALSNLSLLCALTYEVQVDCRVVSKRVLFPAMGGGGGGGGWQGGGGGGGGGGGWERNYLAHNMAYRGYPQPIQPIQPMGDSDDR